MFAHCCEFQPALVANMPEVIAARGTPEQAAVEESASNFVSTRGFVLGYAGGLLLLIINVIIAGFIIPAMGNWFFIF